MDEYKARIVSHGTGLRIYIPADVAKIFGCPNIATVKCDILMKNGKQKKELIIEEF